MWHLGGPCAGWGRAPEDTGAMAGTVIVGAGVSGLATAYFLRERPRS